MNNKTSKVLIFLAIIAIICIPLYIYISNLNNNDNDNNDNNNQQENNQNNENNNNNNENTIIDVDEIFLNITNATISIGDKLKLEVMINPTNASDKSVIWSSSNPSIAAVVDGEVLAIANGSAIITVATNDGEKEAECLIVVSEKIVPVSSITLTNSELSLNVGEEKTINVTIKPDDASNKEVIWNSSNEQIATVTNGKIKALSAGNVTIAATTIDGELTAFCRVNVIKPVENKWGPYYNQNLTYKGMNYILYYPSNVNIAEKNPLIVFLHGSNGSGTNINQMFGSKMVFVNNMKNGKFKDAIYLAPQCVCNTSIIWDNCLDNVKSLIDEIVVQYNVNPQKIAITGHSLGGIAVYDMIARYPRFFSSAVVLAGYKRTDTKVANLIYTPIRHYHGTLDTNVRYSLGQNTVYSIKSAGGNATFIPLEDEEHDIQNVVYNDTDAIRWMINQLR